MRMYGTAVSPWKQALISCKPVRLVSSGADLFKEIKVERMRFRAKRILGELKL
jgi:hypothetical protein